MNTGGSLAALTACLFLLFPWGARANVYATDIKLNGSTNNAAMIAGQMVQINYILNEPASGGVSVQIYSGTNLVRTLLASPGTPGAMAGANALTWDCKNQAASNVAPGAYGIEIMAAANGYLTWTNITDDGPAFQVPQPTAIAVNKNTNSLFYGRVFVSSSPNSGAPLGICKFNADGSPADEGGFSTGGYPWGGTPFYSPWKISISDDDKVYINDWGESGMVMAFDELITTNNFVVVLSTDNYPYPNPQLSGPYVQGAGTNTQIWMADNTPGGAGIVRWNLGADGTIASNDTGTVIVTVTNGSDLNWAPYDVALDTNGNIYTIQRVDGADFPSFAPMMRVFKFPPYAGWPETAAVWKVGAFSDSLDYAFGVAVDPSATYVAVAARGDGAGSGEILENGGVSIFYAGNGVLITNIQQNASGGTNVQCWDVAWDNVGNVYTADGSDGVWRVYSPPGTNHSTTASLPFVQVYQTFIQPVLGSPMVRVEPTGLAQFQFTLQGQSNVTYLVEESPDLANWAVVATNYSTAPGRTLTLQPADPQGFYRAVVAPPF
jgi:hypothetical protein